MQQYAVEPPPAFPNRAAAWGGPAAGTASDRVHCHDGPVDLYILVHFPKVGCTQGTRRAPDRSHMLPPGGLRHSQDRWCDTRAELGASSHDHHALCSTVITLVSLVAYDRRVISGARPTAFARCARRSPHLLAALRAAQPPVPAQVPPCASRTADNRVVRHCVRVARTAAAYVGWGCQAVRPSWSAGRVGHRARCPTVTSSITLWPAGSAASATVFTLGLRHTWPIYTQIYTQISVLGLLPGHIAIQKASATDQLLTADKWKEASQKVKPTAQTQRVKRRRKAQPRGSPDGCWTRVYASMELI